MATLLIYSHIPSLEQNKRFITYVLSIQNQKIVDRFGDLQLSACFTVLSSIIDQFFGQNHNQNLLKKSREQFIIWNIHILQHLQLLSFVKRGTELMIQEKNATLNIPKNFSKYNINLFEKFINLKQIKTRTIRNPSSMFEIYYTIITHLSFYFELSGLHKPTFSITFKMINLLFGLKFNLIKSKKENNLSKEIRQELDEIVRYIENLGGKLFEEEEVILEFIENTTTNNFQFLTMVISSNYLKSFVVNSHALYSTAIEERFLKKYGESSYQNQISIISNLVMMGKCKDQLVQICDELIRKCRDPEHQMNAYLYKITILGQQKNLDPPKFKELLSKIFEILDRFPEIQNRINSFQFNYLVIISVELGIFDKKLILKSIDFYKGNYERKYLQKNLFIMKNLLILNKNRLKTPEIEAECQNNQENELDEYEVAAQMEEQIIELFKPYNIPNKKEDLEVLIEPFFATPSNIEEAVYQLIICSGQVVTREYFNGYNYSDIFVPFVDTIIELDGNLHFSEGKENISTRTRNDCIQKMNYKLHTIKVDNEQYYESLLKLHDRIEHHTFSGNTPPN